MIKSRSAPMQIFDTAKIKLLIMFLGLQNIKKACMLVTYHNQTHYYVTSINFQE